MGQKGCVSYKVLCNIQDLNSNMLINSVPSFSFTLAAFQYSLVISTADISY